ncbi:hypothetical protein [Nocardia asteroides]|uniref:hypothetical protein n=1 Tax=Nocardia asteroides TaxID=1824 RepID=UPI001E419D65|nr:hypothetical protein [Nocardia asteroides]UGT57514.1 hypothetical protein LTT85_12010 [Nocardia asteroides]
MTQDQGAYWRQMKQQAINGDFKIEEDLGKAIADVANQYIADLERQRDFARSLNRLNGWGGLPSAKDLRAKFEKKAVTGGPDGADDSAVARIDQHIAIARDQRDTFLAAIGQLQAVDQQTAGALGATGQGI